MLSTCYELRLKYDLNTIEINSYTVFFVVARNPEVEIKVLFF